MVDGGHRPARGGHRRRPLPGARDRAAAPGPGRRATASPGQGSLFAVRLPRVQQGAAAAPGGLGVRRVRRPACGAGPGASAAAAAAQDARSPRGRRARAQLAERLQRAWQAQGRDRLPRRSGTSPTRGRAGGGDRLRRRALRAPRSSALEVLSPPPGRRRSSAELHARAFTRDRAARAASSSGCFALERGDGGLADRARARRCRASTACVHLSLDPQAYRADGADVAPRGLRAAAAARARSSRRRRASGPPCSCSSARARCACARARRGARAAPPVLRHARAQGARARRLRAASIPADLHRVLSPVALHARTRTAHATWPPRARSTTSRSPRSFVLDTSLPRSPWWIFPGLGDAAVTLPHARAAARSPTRSARRSPRASACSTASGGARSACTRWPAASTRLQRGRRAASVDVLEHDLLGPLRARAAAGSTARTRCGCGLRPSSSTLRLRLDDSLARDLDRVAPGRADSRSSACATRTA